ncbi:MAG: tape measure protein [Prevotella sp.]|nr:tape measure protein [Prevotella sp.]
MKQAMGIAGKLDKKTSGFMTGILQGAGQQAFYMLSNGCRELVSEIDASNVAWKTFEGNMKILGKNDKQINKVRKSMQKYAEQTIYSSSDMASTYSQLAAVGVKSADKLVTGFGGLAAAAENPQQAMKTLSQQATQMAGRPKVAWQDFKLMLEQTPAGIAAVAKEMGMTTSELVSKIQAGEVKTNDFFNAIEKVGNSKGFTKLATSYKSAGQAMDGLKETIGNKLTPAYDALSKKAIGGIEGIIDKVSELDGEQIKDKVLAGIDKAMPYWEQFKNVLSVTGKVLKTVGNFFMEHSNILSKGIPIVLGLVAAYKGFKVVNTIVGGVKSFVGSITSLAGGTGSKIAENLNKTATAQQNVGKVSQASSTQMMASAKAFMMMGAGVLLIAAGFGILAYSAIQLANAGPMAIAVMAGMVAALVGVSFAMAGVLKFLAPMSAQLMPASMAMLAMGAAVLLVAAGFAIMAYAAIKLANSGGLAIGVMAGMVVAMAGLMALAAVLGPALTAGAIGMLAFGAAVLLAGAGVALACVGLAQLAGVLPIIVAYGTQAAGAIMALGAGLMVFAAGALLAGAASLVLGAGLLVAAAGIIVFGAAMVGGAAGTVVMAGALKLVSSSMKSISSSAKTAQSSLNAMRSAVKTVESGLNAIGSKANSAMSKLKSAFSGAAGSAMSAGNKVGTGFSSGVKSGMNTAKSAASSGVKAVTAKLKSGSGAARSAGTMISRGFAAGMRSCLGQIRSAANEMVKAANKAIQAKAKIHSPSRVTMAFGEYYGEGYELGILGMVRDAKRAAEKLISVPTTSVPTLAMAYEGGLSSEYDYYRQNDYTIEVPLTVDGKEFARATAKYSQEELNKRTTRDNRKKGKV